MTYQSIEYFTSFIDELDWSRPSDKREQARLSKSLLIRVQPLTPEFRDAGKALQGITSDLSSGGMGFLCNQPIKLAHCRICLPGSRVSVIAKVRHARMIGGMPVVFQFGVEYLPTPENTTHQSISTDAQCLEIAVCPGLEHEPTLS